jgi:hypothetical protein
MVGVTSNNAAENPTTEPVQLYYGDLIYLEWDGTQAAEKTKGPFLFADGFLESRTMQNVRCVEKIPGGTDSLNCAFRLCWPVSYDHRKQLQLSKKFSGKNQPSSASLQLEQRNRDEKTREAETKNAGIMASHMGKQYPMHYNDKVQLQHVKSSKFLTLQENCPVADLDPMCLKLFLSTGTEGSLFQIIGLYKTQIPGSTVFSVPPLRLLNCRLGDHYLHTTRQEEGAEAKDGGKHSFMQLEVDLSTKQGNHEGWTLQPYQQYSNDNLEHLLLGQPVALLHSEEEKYVCCGGETINPDHDDALDATKDSTTLKIYFVFESPEQGATKLKGGKVMWGEPYRLRHMASGHYLSAGEGGKVQMRQLHDKQGGGDPASFLFALTPTQIAGAQDRGEFVQLVEVRQSGCCIENHGGGGKTWLHKIDNVEKFVLSTTKYDEDAYCIAPLPEADAPELYRVSSFIRATEEYLRSYLRPHDSVAMKRSLKHFHEVLKGVNAWLRDGDRDQQQQDIIRDLEFLDALMWAFLGPFLYKHDTTFDVTDAPLKSGMVGSPVRAQQGTQAPFRYLTSEDELPHLLLRLQKELCDVTKAAIRKNSKSQLYFAQKTFSGSWLSPELEELAKTPELSTAGGIPLWDFAHRPENDRWVEALTNQLQWRAGVGGIFVCMMENNYTVLTHHIDEALLSKFVHWMRQKGPFAEWLNVLSVVCVCNHQRVPQQQEGVMRMLLSVKDFEGKVNPAFATNRKKLVIETILDHTPQFLRPYAPTTDIADFTRLIGKDEGWGESVVRATIAVPAGHASDYSRLAVSEVVEAGVHYLDVQGTASLRKFESAIVNGVAHLVPSAFSGSNNFEFRTSEILGKHLASPTYLVSSLTYYPRIQASKCI